MYVGIFFFAIALEIEGRKEKEKKERKKKWWKNSFFVLWIFFFYDCWWRHFQPFNILNNNSSNFKFGIVPNCIVAFQIVL